MLKICLLTLSSFEKSLNLGVIIQTNLKNVYLLVLYYYDIHKLLEKKVQKCDRHNLDVSKLHSKKQDTTKNVQIMTNGIGIYLQMHLNLF